MTQTSLTRFTAAAGGALLLTGIAAAPALAEDYPPSDPSNNSVDTNANPATVTTPSNGQTPAYTGAATTLGLAVGVVVLGAGAGLLIASRRRSN